MSADLADYVLDGIQDLLESKTWNPREDDLNFAVGYVCSHVRQVTGKACDEATRAYVVEALLVVVR